jgi:hypothetical protein
MPAPRWRKRFTAPRFQFDWRPYPGCGDGRHVKSGAIIFSRGERGEEIVQTADGERLAAESPGDAPFTWGAKGLAIDAPGGDALSRAILNYYAIRQRAPERVASFSTRFLATMPERGGRLELVEIASWLEQGGGVDRSPLGQVLPAESPSVQRVRRFARLLLCFFLPLGIFAWRYLVVSPLASPFEKHALPILVAFVAFRAAYDALGTKESLRAGFFLLFVFALEGSLKMLFAGPSSAMGVVSTLIVAGAIARVAALLGIRRVLRRKGYPGATLDFASALLGETNWRFGWFRGCVLFPARLAQLPRYEDLATSPLLEAERPTRGLALAIHLRDAIASGTRHPAQSSAAEG